MATAAASAVQSTLPKRAFAIIFCSSVATAIGNTGLISVLPLIGRSLKIPDEMVVAIFSLSAILWACSSPFWAKASDRYGRKPLMMVGLTGFMISMTVCGAVVSAGLRQMAAPMVIFGLLLLGRSLFGLFGAASNPANQAYVADHTPREQRTQAMASLAGAYRAAGRVPAAMQLSQQCCANSERILGPDHADTLTRQANLAALYYTAGRVGDAVTLLRETVLRCERVLPAGDPLTRAVQESLMNIGEA